MTPLSDQQLPDPAPAPTAFDRLASELQHLRLEAGAISYTELAERITAHREAQGTAPAAARVARSSVYDVFRSGRKRVNPDLVAEIVLALGGSDSEAAEWRQRTIAARDESVQVESGEVESGQAESADNAGPAATGVPHSLFTAVLCLALVGLNHALNFSANALHLPLYLDMVGTAFVAFAFGPLAGAAVGVGTNIVGNVMNGDFSGSWFALVQISGAVAWGYGFRRWFGRGPLRFFLLNIVVALVSSAVALPIILFAFDGVSTLNVAAALGGTAQQFGTGPLGTLVSVNVLTSLGDKMISGYLALTLLWALARSGYAFAPEVHERITRVWPFSRP